MNTAENIVLDYSKRLPEAEYEVMNTIWNGVPPLNTAYLMEAVGKEKGWKAPTLISFLVRLEERGFISSTKHGKERFYMPEADKIMYMQRATEQFVFERGMYKLYFTSASVLALFHSPWGWHAKTKAP